MVCFMYRTWWLEGIILYESKKHKHIYPSGLKNKFNTDLQNMQTCQLEQMTLENKKEGILDIT